MAVTEPDTLREPGFVDLATARRIERVLVFAIVFLVLSDLLTSPARTADPPSSPIFFWALFNLSEESGIGTWYAAVQLAAAGACGALVWRMERARMLSSARWWGLLAALMIAASAEEIIGLHEASDRYIELGDMRERISFMWVLAGAAVSGALGLLFAPFILTRKPAIRWRLLSSALLYVVGAVGLEVVGGALLAAGEPGGGYLVVSIAEEGLELAGAGLVLSAGIRQAILHLTPATRERMRI